MIAMPTVNAINVQGNANTVTTAVNDNNVLDEIFNVDSSMDGHYDPYEYVDGDFTLEEELGANVNALNQSGDSFPFNSQFEPDHSNVGLYFDLGDIDSFDATDVSKFN